MDLWAGSRARARSIGADPASRAQRVSVEIGDRVFEHRAVSGDTGLLQISERARASEHQRCALSLARGLLSSHRGSFRARPGGRLLL
jgi:hypothetical protein